MDLSQSIRQAHLCIHWLRCRFCINVCTKSAPSYSTQKEIGKYFYGRYFAILFYDLIYNWCFLYYFLFQGRPLGNPSCLCVARKLWGLHNSGYSHPCPAEADLMGRLELAEGAPDKGRQMRVLHCL